MKKILILLLAAAISSASLFGAETKANPADILKDKANFSKLDLFENEAVFLDPQINIDVVKAYEQNPSAYADNELLPIALCYMTLQQPQKTMQLLEKFMAACPDNLRALRTYATLVLLNGDQDKALSLYKKAYDSGDKEVAKSIAMAFVLMGKPGEMGPYIEDLKAYAKTELSPFTMLLIYAYRNQDAKDLVLAKSAISALDTKKAMETAATDSVVACLNLYLAEKSVWDPKSLVIPAKGASLSGHLGLAREIYNQVLEADPKNTEALRGKAVVEFKLGGLMDAANLIKSAIDAGDKSAVNDAMELALTAKSEAVYNMFKPMFEGFDFNLPIRLAMLNFSVKYPDNADIFFMSIDGENGEKMMREASLKPAISEGLKKYNSDSRAAKYSDFALKN